MLLVYLGLVYISLLLYDSGDVLKKILKSPAKTICLVDKSFGR